MFVFPNYILIILLYGLIAFATVIQFAVASMPEERGFSMQLDMP